MVAFRMLQASTNDSLIWRDNEITLIVSSGLGEGILGVLSIVDESGDIDEVVKLRGHDQ